MKAVTRVSALSPSRFRQEFLVGNKPVVVTDGLANSPATTGWTLDYFEKRFGELDVALSGEFFSPLRVMKLAAFIGLVRHLEQAEFTGAVTPYLRLAYPEFGGADFTSIFFDAMKDEWDRPYFLPDRLYFSPFSIRSCPPNRRRFPEWGLFISPRGAVTSLHIDRTNDNTILAATCGRKIGYLFEPSNTVLTLMAQEHLAREQGRRCPALERTLHLFQGHRPWDSEPEAYYFELNPGEVLFIPKRWAHEVYTISASVTFTYNFLHFSDIDRLYLMHRFLDRGVH